VPDPVTPPEPDRLTELSRNWQAAEDRLYPLVMVRPDAYAVAVTLVRSVADRLQSEASADDLVSAYETAADLVARVVAEVGASSDGIDLGLVAGAAFNLRLRDIRAAAQREQAKSRILVAREQQQEWVLLFETGTPDRAPMAPYRRLDMRLADGFGVHASITMDPMTALPSYVIETVQLDPVTGDWLPEAPADIAATLATREEWTRALDDLRATSAE
jgi:hypothetical protein